MKRSIGCSRGTGWLLRPAVGAATASFRHQVRARTKFDFSPFRAAELALRFAGLSPCLFHLSAARAPCDRVIQMAASEQIWSEALRTLERDKPFALATVINVRGSTPREVGAKMIIRDDGQFGTIGGGCGEAEVFRKARLL